MKKTNGTMPTQKPASKLHPKHAEDLALIFEDLLKDIFWAENHLVKALPKMVKAAHGKDLKAGFTTHLSETKNHVVRLQKVFELMGKKAAGKKCLAMEGLVKEVEEAFAEYEEGFGRDATLIVAAQKIEHYEIAAYGSLKTHAHLLGLDEVAKLFLTTLNEEKTTDQTLTTLSETINEWALQPEEA